jgi:hypothetical protein
MAGTAGIVSWPIPPFNPKGAYPWIIVIAALARSLVFSGAPPAGLRCRLRSPERKTADDAHLNAIHYNVQGVVLGKSPQSQQSTIEQSAVPRMMPATPAVYRILQASVFQVLRTGDTVAGEAVLPNDGSPNELDGVTVTSEPRNPQSLAALPPHMLLEGERSQTLGRSLRDHGDSSGHNLMHPSNAIIRGALSSAESDAEQAFGWGSGRGDRAEAGLVGISQLMGGRSG